MGRFLPRTLFWQLVVATLLVQTVLLFLYVSYLVGTQRSLARARAQQRAIHQLELLAPLCASLLNRTDRVTLQQALALARSSSGMDQVRITDAKGRALALSDPARDHGLDEAEQSAIESVRGPKLVDAGRGQAEAVAPIVRDGKTIALLWLEPNRDQVVSPADTVLRIAGTYGIFALVADLLPIFLVVRGITRPLHQLTQATSQIAQDPTSDGEFPLLIGKQKEAGELTGSFNTMVQELRDHRRGLLETLALLDSMLENAPVGFAFFDRELRYVRANAHMAEMYRVSSDGLPGQRGSDICPGEVSAQVDESVQHVFLTGDPVRDVEVNHPTGHAGSDSERSYLMHFYPVRTKEQLVRWVGVVAVEITERRKAEEALRKTEKLAATGRLAASIAHEINNPLEAVTNVLYLLSTQDSLDCGTKELVQTAQDELARVSEITQQTLRFYRQSTFPVPTSIADLISSVVKLYQPRLSRANVSVVWRVRGEPIAFAYNGELRQVFANLIGNALDAMPEGGVLTLSVRRGSGRLPDGSCRSGARVFVSDTGSGISAASQKKLFEPFFTTKEATGTGLGLWLSREIVTKHGGTVRLRSKQGLGHGTTFVLFFPDGGLQVQRASGSASELP